MDNKLMNEAGVVAGILGMTRDEYIEGLVKRDLYRYRNEKGEVDPKLQSDGSYLKRMYDVRPSLPSDSERQQRNEDS